MSTGTAVNVGDSGLYEVGADDPVGSIAGSGAIKLDSSTLSVGGDNSSTEFSGVVSGTGGLAKRGSGALTLSGANTYTGSTAINNGALVVSGSLSDETDVLIDEGSVYELGSSDRVGSIAGGGSIVLNTFQLTAGNELDTTFLG